MEVQTGTMYRVRSLMAKRARLAILLATSALLAMPAQSLAQTAQKSANEQAGIVFSIGAQPLARALNALSRTSGWQIGYPAGLLNGLRSQPVAGRMSVEAALRTMLAGSGVGFRVTSSSTVTLFDTRNGSTGADAGDATSLEPILLQGATGDFHLGGESASDTGTTTLSGSQIAVRSAGNDANDLLRNMPNVQYQNDLDDDAGITDQSVINTKPREVSISGARIYENNFILNGMPINTVTGTSESSDDELEDGPSPPNYDAIAGLHSQSVYVPTDFIESATLIDSNASARYGNFQGGVVSYKLQDANRERWGGSVSTDFTTSDWAGFHVATTDGLNPNNVERQSYLKRRAAFTITGPITENVAVLGQYSTQRAETEKDKGYRYTEKDSVQEDSRNDFYRGQIIAETDLGDFTLEGIYTHYDQTWENAEARNMAVNQASRGLTTKLEHSYQFSDLDLAGIALSNIKLNSKLTYGSSDSLNDTNSNIARAYKQSYTRSRAVVWEATELSDWCRTDPSITINTICYDGATGDKEQGQKQFTWGEELTADLWKGSILLGAEYSYTEAYRRRPEQGTLYGIYTTLGEVSGLDAFTCNTTEECSAEMFASNKAIYEAYDIRATLNQFTTYAELEQSWDWVNVRAGARVTYDDYMNNLDVAPRAVVNITPWDDFTVSVGANRYYNAQSLAYAIRDQRPRAQTYTRKQIDGVVDDTWTVGTSDTFANSASGLNTPYTDEISFAMTGIDPLLDGQWRLRYLNRQAKDQFASTKSGNDYTLSNDGSGAYQSVSAEYARELKSPGITGLNRLLFNTSITWSKSEVSNDSYFEDSLDEDYIWYKGQSYTKSGFSVVTGNMDIPLRLQASLSSTWLDESLTVDVAANYNFAYTAARYTDENVTVDGKSHEIYADHDFSGLLTFDLAASYKVYEKDNAGLSLNLRVENLFNDTGNALSSTSNPWMIGRTVWVGAKATF